MANMFLFRPEILESEVQRELEDAGLHPTRVAILRSTNDHTWTLHVEEGKVFTQLELPILENFNLSIDGFVQRIVTPAVGRVKELFKEKQNAS